MKKLSLKREHRCFSLLEIMLAIALLLFSSSLVGWRLHHSVQKKRFETEVERLKARFLSAHRLAMAMQIDWQGVFKKGKKGWVLQTYSQEFKGRKLLPLRFDTLEVWLDGKPVTELTVDFFSTGYVLPQGKLTLQRGKEKKEWNLSELGPKFHSLV